MVLGWMEIIVCILEVYSTLKIKCLHRPEEPNPVQIPIFLDFVEVNLSTIKTGSDKSFTYTSTFASFILIIALNQSSGFGGIVISPSNSPVLSFLKKSCPPKRKENTDR